MNSPKNAAELGLKVFKKSNRKDPGRDAGSRISLVLFIRSRFAKVILHKNVFFDLLHLIYSLPEEKRVKYANRISMSRFLALPTPVFSVSHSTPLQSPPRHHFSFGKGASSDETDAEPRLWIAAFAFAQANRKNCSAGAWKYDGN